MENMTDIESFFDENMTDVESFFDENNKDNIELYYQIIKKPPNFCGDKAQISHLKK